MLLILHVFWFQEGTSGNLIQTFDKINFEEENVFSMTLPKNAKCQNLC